MSLPEPEPAEIFGSGITVRALDELRLAERLPSPPALGLALIGLTRDAGAPLVGIVETIRADAALTGRLIKSANASRPSGTPPATTALAAARLLHPEKVRELALGFSLVSRERGEVCEGFDHRRHWLLSLATAAAAEALAGQFGAKDPEEAFTLGLLARVGMLAMATVHPESFARLLRENLGQDQDALVLAEVRTFRIHHWQMAVDLMTDWGIPETVLEPLAAFAKCAFGARRDDAETIRSTSMVQLALEMGEDLVLAAEGARPAAPAKGRQELVLARRIAEPRWRELADLCGLGDLCGPGARSGTEAGATPADDATPPASGEPSAPAKAATRVLVVDDEPGQRHLIGFHLRRAGFEVITAEDGESGMSAVLAQSPQIVVSDWMMPGMSGLDLCKALRRSEFGRKLYLLLLTAMEEEDRIVEGLEAGANDYVTKPFNPRILLARVRAGERMVELQRQVELDKQKEKKQMREMGKLTRELRNAAYNDALTGLPNRRSAMKELEAAWSAAERSGRPLSVAMIDIDHFKKVNDRHGHQAGDEVLRAVAKILRANSRRSDQVYRLGGEEFLLIGVNGDVHAVAKGAERLREQVAENPIRVAGFDGRVTISLGVAERDAGMKTIDDLIKAADEAVYRAKAQGRNQVCSYTPPGTLSATA